MQKKVTKKKGAPSGNQFWRLVQMPTGRPKKYSPATLWKKAAEYFAWNDKHPLIERKVFSNGYSTNLKRMRPLTETSFCLFAGIDENTFQRYKGHDDYKDFWAVTECISKIIYQQKFDGAAVDFFNANIISRELGLIDRQKFGFDLDELSEENAKKVAKYVLELHKKNSK